MALLQQKRRKKHENCGLLLYTSESRWSHTCYQMYIWYTIWNVVGSVLCLSADNFCLIMICFPSNSWAGCRTTFCRVVDKGPAASCDYKALIVKCSIETFFVCKICYGSGLCLWELGWRTLWWLILDKLGLCVRYGGTTLTRILCYGNIVFAGFNEFCDLQV